MGSASIWAWRVGHDLVGASGFTNALWADSASVVVGRHFNAPAVHERGSQLLP